MKLIKTAAAGLILAFALAVPGMANASGESAEASFTLTPKQGQFQKNTLLPAKWEVKTTVSTADPIILPMKVADLKFPAGQMTFSQNSSAAVCPDSDIGPPPTNMSVTVPVAVARCPNAVLGNGTAKFVLGRNNLNPIAVLDGVMVVFNGGLKGGRPLIKVYAYSYDTNVGIYTEAALQADGTLLFNIPPLTSDSAVSQLNLAIPSKQITLNDWGPGEETVVLPAGKDANYVKARCASGSWPFEATFTLGTRDISGNPTSPDSFISDTGSTPCTAAVPRARIGSVRILGPGAARRGRPAVYRVVVKNTGSATATGVRAVLVGRGVRVNAPVGSIPAGRSKTVRVRVKFRSKGRIRISAKVNSRNGGARTGAKVVRVR
jgi:hypothetical protein